MTSARKKLARELEAAAHPQGLSAEAVARWSTRRAKQWQTDNATAPNGAGPEIVQLSASAVKNWLAGRSAPQTRDKLRTLLMCIQENGPARGERPNLWDEDRWWPLWRAARGLATTIDEAAVEVADENPARDPHHDSEPAQATPAPAEEEPGEATAVEPPDQGRTDTHPPAVSEHEPRMPEPKPSRRTLLKAAGMGVAGMGVAGGIAWLAGVGESSPSRGANPSARSRASLPAPESGRSMTPSSAVAFPRFIGQVSDAACSFDGRYVVFGEESGSLQIWDLSTLRQTVTMQAHEGSVRRVVFSGDGSLLATSGPDGEGTTVKLWAFSPPDGLKRVAMWHQDHDAWALAFHPVGTALLSGDNNRTIWRYDVVRREPISNLIPGEELGWVRNFTFTKDGRSLLVGDTLGHIHRWDTTQPLQDWSWSWRTDIDDADPIGGIWALALAPDDTTLVSGDQPPDGRPRARVRRWDLTDPTRRPNKPQVLATYDNSTVYSADFSAKATLITASQTTVRDARTGGTAHLWKMPYQHGKRLPTIINSSWVRFVPGTETLVAITAASQPIMIREHRNPAR